MPERLTPEALAEIRAREASKTFDVALAMQDLPRLLEHVAALEAEVARLGGFVAFYESRYGASE